MATIPRLSVRASAQKAMSATPGSTPARRGLAITAMLEMDTRAQRPTDSTRTDSKPWIGLAVATALAVPIWTALGVLLV